MRPRCRPPAGGRRAHRCRCSSHLDCKLHRQGQVLLLLECLHGDRFRGTMPWRGKLKQIGSKDNFASRPCCVSHMRGRRGTKIGRLKHLMRVRGWPRRLGGCCTACGSEVGGNGVRRIGRRQAVLRCHGLDGRDFLAETRESGKGVREQVNTRLGDAEAEEEKLLEARRGQAARFIPFFHKPPSCSRCWTHWPASLEQQQKRGGAGREEMKPRLIWDCGSRLSDSFIGGSLGI